MTSPKVVDITEELAARIEAVRRAEGCYPTADEGYLPIAIAKAALGEAFLRAIDQQQRLARLPARAQPARVRAARRRRKQSA